MIKVIGVSFDDSSQLYYFEPNNLDLRRNVTVIVETQRGKQFAKVELPSHEINENNLNSPLKKVIRIATKNDYSKHKKNKQDEQEALQVCRQLIAESNLKMQVIDASFTFDRSQLLFRFTADGRIDFRELVRFLANKYKTRIELRQIGVRDKAKEVGGCGICGRELCCARFNDGNFASVSINMAKNQNLSLNPAKINGACGRLLCCLRYEDDMYKSCRKGMPTIGSIVETEKGKGKVVSIDILKNKYTVDVINIGTVDINGSN